MPAFIAACGILLLVVASCRKEDSETVTNDLRASVGNRLYHNPLNIQVFDAGDDTHYPENATITVSGPDKRKILSLLGERTISIKDGIIQLGVNHNHAPSESNPLRFNLTIEAPGYLKFFKSFYLTNGEEPMHETIRLFNVSNLPEGASYSSQEMDLNRDGELEKDVVLKSPGSGDLSLTFKKGTYFPAGHKHLRLKGKVKMALVRFDATKEAAVDGFPGGLAHENATNKSGQDLGEGIFTPYGFYQIVVTVGNQEAKMLSKAVEVSMKVSTDLKRSLGDEAGASLRSGDEVDIWSFNEDTQEWHGEDKGKVSDQTLSSVYVKFKQTHLSLWGACDRRGRSNGCANPGLRIQYPSNTRPATGVQSSACFYVKVRDANNPNHVICGFYANLWHNSLLDLRRCLKRTNKKVIIDISDNESGTYLTRTGILMPCGQPTLNLSGLGDVRTRLKYFTFNINMSAVCGNRNNSAAFFPSATIYVAEVGSSTSSGRRYRFAGNMQNGKMSTCLLRKEICYEFKVVRGPLSATTKDLGMICTTFPSNNSACTIRFRNPTWGLDQNVTAFATDANTYLLNLPNFQAPEYLCNKWFQYFR